MRMEQYLQCIDYTLWDIMENGNAPIVTKTIDGKETIIPPTSVEDKQYENFAPSSTEVIKKTYERLQKLISQLEMHEIETLSLDDLFNNLKAYESEVMKTSSSTTNSHNIAFMSSSGTNNTTRAVNTAQGVTTASTQGTADSSTTVENLSDASDQVEEGPTNFALMAYSSTSSNYFTNSEIMDKCKRALGFNVVPPPYTRNFMPPNPYLVYPSLDDFVDVNESVSESVVEKPIVESNEPKTVRKENKAIIIEDWVSKSEEEDEPKF
nr:hypothetical protein [Tanacetum cinerariifolium]